MAEQNMQIKWVSVKDSIPEISYQKRDIDQMHWTKIDESYKSIVHPDFIQALKNLRPHLAILTGYMNPALIKQIDSIKEDAVDDFYVHGLSIGGKDDDPGVTVSGHRITPLGKAVTLNTPFYRFSEDEKSYKFIKDFVDKVKRVIDVEAPAFVDGTKRGTDPQQSLFDNNNGVEKKPAEVLEEVQEEKKPEKKDKKKRA
jgi:hypothetical protein